MQYPQLTTTKIASTDPTRAALTGVLFTGKKTVATDGYTLLEITNKNAEPVPVPFIANNEQLKKIKIKKNNTATIAEQTDETTTFETDGVLYPVQKMKDETYPDYEKIIPGGLPRATIHLSAVLLGKLAKAMEDIDNGSHMLKIEVRGPEQPVVITTENTAKTLSARGLIMPIKVN